MCGRMNISDHEGILWLLGQLGLILPEEQFTPKYNVSPTAAIWGALISRTATTLEPMQWGFVPPWAKKDSLKGHYLTHAPRPFGKSLLLKTSSDATEASFLSMAFTNGKDRANRESRNTSR